MSFSGDNKSGDVADLRKRLALALIGVTFLVIIYAVLYRWAVIQFTDEERSLLNAIQVVIEALTTAGFGGDTDLWREHDVLAFLIIVMNLTGVLLVFLALPLFAFPLFREAMDTKPPTSSNLTNHVVICGHSMMDDVLQAELDNAGIEHLFIESDPQEVEQLIDDGSNAIYGNAERVKTLKQANLEHATALVADLDDETNPTVLLSAKRVNPDAKLISVVDNRRAITHHRYAGADKVVVSKEGLGESLALRSMETVSERFRTVVSVDTQVGFHEFLVEEDSALVGKTIREAAISDRYGLTIIGGWFGARFRISPPPNTEILPNTILFVSGTNEAFRSEGVRCLPSHQGHPDRVVVCGYGDVGQSVARTLRSEGIKATIVDGKDLPGVDIVGDITEEQTLEAADINNARSVVLAVDEDSTAIYSSILIKHLAPNIEIIARANDPENVWKLYNAGTDYVLSLPAVTGELLASQLIRNEEILTPRDEFEFVRTTAPDLTGQSLREADIRNKTGCTIVAIERTGTLRTEFGATEEIRAKDVLIGAGSREAIEAFRSLAGEQKTKYQDKSANGGP